MPASPARYSLPPFPIHERRAHAVSLLSDRPAAQTSTQPGDGVQQVALARSGASERGAPRRGVADNDGNIARPGTSRTAHSPAPMPPAAPGYQVARAQRRKVVRSNVKGCWYAA